MRIVKIIYDLICRFGCRICVSKDDEVNEYPAFIEPLRYKNKLYLDGTSLTQGLFDGSHWLMIAPPELSLIYPLDEYIVECAAMNKQFTVKKCDTYYLQDKPLYLWAILGQYRQDGENENEP